MISTVQLFLGLPINQTCAYQIAQLNPHLLSSFINENESYLQEINFESNRYIGKKMGNSTDLTELELLEANIYSLLKKLLPDYPWLETPLVLLTVQNHEAS